MNARVGAQFDARAKRRAWSWRLQPPTMTDPLTSFLAALRQLTVPVLLGIALTAAILLFVGDHAAAFLRLRQFGIQHRTDIALTFVASVSLLFGRAVVALWPLVWRKLTPPLEAVVLIPEGRPNALLWSLGTRGNKSAQQVVGDFTITNRTEQPLYLLHAVLRRRRWFLLGRPEQGTAAVGDFQSPNSGEYPIPPRAITTVRLQFVGTVRERPARRRFVADVAVVDQFGNHHWLRRLVFRDTDLPMEEQ